jgi:hypothetical protein
MAVSDHSFLSGSASGFPFLLHGPKVWRRFSLKNPSTGVEPHLRAAPVMRVSRELISKC